MAPRAGLGIAARVLAAVVGSYAVTAGASALIGVLLVVVARLGRSDALIIGSVLGYLLFVFLMLWCFAERRLLRVWAIVVVAAVVTHLAAWLVAPAMSASGGVS